MTKISPDPVRRKAIIRYKLAARSYRRRMSPRPHPSEARTSYAQLETARNAMLAAIGYDRQYGYIGEFCNLHERDFPNMIRCKPDHEGLYRHHGFAGRITKAAHVAAMWEARKRALHISRMVCLPPVERWLAGWHVHCGDHSLAAGYVNGCILTFKPRDFGLDAVAAIPSDDETARVYFGSEIVTRGEVYWQELLPFDIEEAMRLIPAADNL